MIATNIPSYARDPSLALRIPLFPLSNAFLWLILAFQKSLAFLEHYVGTLGMHLAGVALCAAEIIRPGCILGLPRWMVRRLRIRLAQGRSRTGAPWRSMIVLAALCTVFAVIFRRRLEEGLFTRGSMQTFGMMVVRYYLPIAVLFAAIRRLPLFARIERSRLMK
jgi:hypothetical protein